MKKDEIRRDELRALFDSLKPWGHLMYVQGVPTKTESKWGEPIEYPVMLWDKIKPLLPDLRGKTVLDVGCNDGFFAFECRRLGASRVMGIEGDSLAIKHANLVNGLLGLGDIDFKHMTVYDIDSSLGAFNVTLFLGVLYHLKSPMLVLEKLSSITSETIIVDSAIRNSMVDIENRRMKIKGEPVMEFNEQVYIPHMTDRAMLDDFSYTPVYEGAFNWWLPNTECICALLRSCGFKKAEVMDENILPPQRTEVFGRAIVVAHK
jgi:tRNA (mo5U34)-methyltransferase